MSAIDTRMELSAVKRRQRRIWKCGDYGVIAARIMPMAERLVDAAGLRAGDAVLDVATGTGNAAIAAARRGCEVTGVDFVEPLLKRGRERAAAEGLEVEFMVGDAEVLPCADASFDAVLSCVGVMFTPGHVRAARDLVRVCRPGGTECAGELDAGGLRGQDVPDRRPIRAGPVNDVVAGPVGHRGAPAVPPRPCGHGSDVHAAGVRVPLPFSGGVRRRLLQPLRPGAQGVRLAGRVRPRAALPGSRSAAAEPVAGTKRGLR